MRHKRASYAHSPDDRLRIWAERRPDTVAVECHAGTLTYAQLDAMSDAFARAIQERGCSRGDRVALLFGQSGQMIAALFGALRAGAVSVPIDLGWPILRARQVLADAEATLFCCESSLASRGLSMECPATLVWQPHEPRRPAVPRRRPRAIGSPDDPAYILYTSGSTGNPKGVVQSRRNTRWHAAAYARSIGMKPGDRVSLLSSYAFDAAVMDVYGALCHGATLCIYDPRGERLRRLLAWVRDASLSVLHMTPTLYRQLLAMARGRLELPALRVVVLGGEPVYRQDIEMGRAKLPGDVVIVNGFGPTECTVALQYHVPSGAPVALDRVPIGKPVGGVEVTLEDPQGAEVEDGVEGEIVLHSARVALGYWRRSTERFGAFAKEGPSPHRYATGDLGVRTTDGNLVHLGRIDGQLKIRGHRVEPGEIECRLTAMSGIKAAAVTSFMQGRQERLGAWIVSRDDRTLDVERAQNELSRWLPAYLLPVDVFQIAALPVTPSGKVDRRELKPGLAVPRRKQPRAPHLSRTELLLLDIWEDALGPGLSLDDDSFAKGADSLTAVGVIIRIEEAFRREIPAAWLFECRSLAELARRIDGATMPAALTPAHVSRTGTDAIGLTPAQRRYWARCSSGHPTSAFNIGVATTIDGPLVPDALERAWRRLFERHDALRLSFFVRDSQPLQTAAEHVATPLTRYDARAWSKATRQTHIRRQVSRPFSLGQPPLVRGVLYELGAGRSVLLVVCHHLIMDGWSRRLLENELFHLYAIEIGERHADDLAPAPAYLAAAKRIIDGSQPGAERRLHWWARRLKPNGDRCPSIPRNRQATATAGLPNAAVVSLAYDSDMVVRLRRLGRRYGASWFMMVAALQALVAYSRTGHPEILLTTDAARRGYRTRAVVGLFSDVLVLPVLVDPDKGFNRLMSSIRRALANAEATDTHLPFAEIVDGLFPGALAYYDELFPMAVFVEDEPARIRRPGHLLVQAEEINTADSSRDMILTAVVGRDNVRLIWSYRKDRLRRATMHDFARRADVLLGAVAENSMTPLRELLRRFGRNQPPGQPLPGRKL